MCNQKKLKMEIRKSQDIFQLAILQMTNYAII